MFFEDTKKYLNTLDNNAYIYNIISNDDVIFYKIYLKQRELLMLNFLDYSVVILFEKNFLFKKD